MKKNKNLVIALSTVLLSSSFIIPQTITNFEYVAKANEENSSFIRANAKVGTKYSNLVGTISSELGIFGGQGFYITFNNGEAIYVYPGKKDLENIKLAKGDTISFNAQLTEYQSSLQLTKLSNVKVLSKNSVKYEDIKINNINDTYLDKIISIKNLTASNIKKVGKYNSTSFVATDSDGNTIEIFADNRATGDYNQLTTTLKENSNITELTGAVTKFKNKYQIKLLSKDDIKLSNNNEKEQTELLNNIGSLQGESHTSPKLNKNVTINNVVVTKINKNKGFYVQDITPDNNDKTSDAVFVISKENVNIGDILSIEGLVQENLSAGYPEKDKTDLTITELLAKTVTKQGKTTLPKPIKLGNNIPKKIIDNDELKSFDPKEDAIDFWESIEGMLVEVEKPQILGPQKYGYLYVLPSTYNDLTRNNAGGISLQEGYQNTEIIPIMISDKKFRAKAKDYFEENIIGNITYDYSEYKVDATNTKLPKKIDGNLEREKTTIKFDEKKLTIASYNIENFSANNAKKETPEEKVEKIAKSFINEINNPDIISLIEVQDNNGTINDGTTSGEESGKRLANKILELGGVKYNYIEIAPENNNDGGAPGGNIRVAFLYNPNRVNLVKKEAGTSTEAAKFSNGELIKNPARINPNSSAFKNTRKSLAAEFEFNGEKIIVINNHLSSKRGDLPLYGKNQPASESSQLSRIKQVAELRNFVNEGLKQNPNLKFVLTGDFNDFEFSKTIKELEKDENIINLMSRHNEEDRYSYFYRGNNQSLDNILVSKNILNNVIFDAIHVNSSFMEEDGRASDHDPLMIQISFEKENKENGETTIIDNSDNINNNNNGNGNGNININKNNNKDNINKNKNKNNNNDNTIIKNNKQNKKLANTGITTSNSLILGIILLIITFIIKRKNSKY